MDKGSKVLSDVIVFSKYSQYNEQLNRRETWNEIIDRNKEMHLEKFPKLTEEIEAAYKYVYEKKLLPSMRSLQFAGKSIIKNNARLYNCAYLPIDAILAFPEILFLLLSGCGVGYSVRKAHVDELPTIRLPEKTRRHVIGDSIEGWADAVKALMKAYLNTSPLPRFDYSDIRPKGAKLSSGGLAPGPEPLRIALEHVHSILRAKKAGDRLTTLDCHDIICHLSNAVLAGGIRRSALICLFDVDDNDMLNCKVGNWWELNPQRARANNSVVLDVNKASRGDFWYVWKRCQFSNSGEPGIYWCGSDDSSFGTNPCQPGFATVLTPNGIRTFNDIQVGDFIWSETGWTKIVNKQATGIKPVYKYKTSAGIFVGTENHRVVSGGEKIEAKDADSIDILRGKYRGNTGFNIQDIMDGLVLGDGSVHKASNDLVYLYIGDNDQDYHTSEIATLIKQHRPGLKDTAWEVETTITAEELPLLPIRTVPDRYVYADERIVRSFLRGLFSANGSAHSGRVTLKSSCQDLVEKVQLMLSSVGIKSYITTNKPKNVVFRNGEYTCKQSYDLNIATDIPRFHEIIGFIQGYKNAYIVNEILSLNKKSQTRNTHDIKSVEYLEDVEVYDITVDNEPHTYWTGGVNVSNCGEIALRSLKGEKGSGGGFCNLCEIYTTDIASQEDFNNRVRAAAFINTLQASYTDFHYLRPEWKQVADEDALLGIGLTGIADGTVFSFSLSEAANVAVEENRRVAELIGISPSARITTVKPSGTASSVLGCSSGIHARHSPYYLRRIRLGKQEPIYQYLKDKMPKLMEDEFFDPENTAVFSLPIKSPDTATFRTESPIDFLRRVRKVYKDWVVTGHQRGEFTHNVSATISIKDDEWESVGGWMWRNRHNYVGLSCLPYSDANYKQMPFEEITEEEYDKYSKYVIDVDLTEIIETENNTKLDQEAACSGGGSCEIVKL